MDESSYESAKLRNGYFTFCLIQALMQDQGRDSINKVYSTLRDAVSAKVLADLHTHQNPVMSLSDQVTDIVIGAEIAGLEVFARPHN